MLDELTPSRRHFTDTDLGITESSEFTITSRNLFRLVSVGESKASAFLPSLCIALSTAMCFMYKISPGFKERGGGREEHRTYCSKFTVFSSHIIKKEIKSFSENTTGVFKIYLFTRPFPAHKSHHRGSSPRVHSWAQKTCLHLKCWGLLFS